MAQVGSASALGAESHRFKSYYPDNMFVHIMHVMHACNAQYTYMIVRNIHIVLNVHQAYMYCIHCMHVMQCMYTQSSFMVKLTFMPLALFVLGILGIYLNRRNILVMIMSVELILLAVNLNFLLFSVYLDDLMGQVFSLIILTVAAAESAIGLALLVVYHRVRGRISVEFINLLKG